MGLAALLILVAPQGSAPEPPPLALELDALPFAGVPTPRRGEAFTVLAGDADLDGDPDLFVNWHVFAPPALLWNEGGRFRSGERAWSVPENPSVALLDAKKRPMLAAIRARARPGVYLWHSDDASFWFVAFAGPFPAGAEGASVALESSRPILGVFGPAAQGHVLRDERFLRLSFPRGDAPLHAFFATQEVAVQILARVEGARVPVFVGPDFVEHSGPVELWGRDPHGLAWLDVTADPRPELVVVRGALGGQLAPPLAPKFDHFYVARGGPRPAYERVELPRGYGRGRMVQWVDVDADGRPELYVGNKGSPNALLRFDAEFQHAEDVAGALGLAFTGADAFAWLDLDGDGDDDLVTLDAGTGFGLARNDGRRFEPLAAGERGLVLAGTGQPDEELEPSGADSAGPDAAGPVIDQHDLQLLDLENDGDLDLLVSGWGTAGACALFAADGAGFADATERAGLGAARGTTQAVVADLDADGWLDLLCLGKETKLFRNQRGRFQPVPLPPAWSQRRTHVGTACDADGDGCIDVVLAAEDLVLARNRGPQRGTWLGLSVERKGRVPLGALVRAIHADGAVQASRIGSIQRGHLSQGHAALRLATTPDNPLRSVEVRFPGGERRVQAVEGNESLSIVVE